MQVSHDDDGDIFVVRGRKVERLLAMTDLNNPEGIDYLQRQLKRMGVTKALEHAGVKAGDVVRIGEEELTWV